ncbi:MAG: response regulator [Fibrobacteres bacterium]|nr:response regulator [Fibrobacterota bacterium]
MKKIISRILGNYLYSGLDKEGNVDVLRYHVTINALNAFGSLALAYFSIKRLIEGNLIFASLDAVVAFVLIVNIIYLRSTKRHQISGFVTSFIIMFFFLLLFAHGSASKSGAAWSFLAPLFVTSMVGRKLGSIMMIVYYVLSLLIVSVLSDTLLYKAHYEHDYLIVHFIELFLVSVLGYIIESVRDNTQQRLIKSNIEREEFSEALRQSQKLESLGQLAGGIAHDINNMMTIVSGYSEILHKKLKSSNPDQAKFAETIYKTSKRTSDLTGKLLAFARKGKYEERELDFHDLIMETVQMAERTIDPRIKISCEFNAIKYYVAGDKTLLENALLNLILNARDAMPEGGSLTIETDNCVGLPLSILRAKETRKREKTVYIVCRVIDTGIGIDESVKAKLFEPFFTTKEIGKGSGLGLASVYGTMKSHNGIISVDSTPGVGSVFSIYIPVLNVKPTAVVPQENRRESAPQKIRILVVEDEEIIRELLNEILTMHGYVCHFCANGQEAVAYYTVNSHNVDVILLDMLMPIMDGYTCFRLLCKINPQVKVIVMSGYSIDSDAQKMIDEGALGFVQKPFTEETLTATLVKAVS